MKAVISTTHDDKYLFFLPIVCFTWNKLGVDVICFLPQLKFNGDGGKIDLINKYSNCDKYSFVCPEHKEATYAQCSRLYAAALDLPENEILVTSDIDMAVFKIPPYEEMFWSGLTVYGGDLTPQWQFPMCYASGTVKDWREVMEIGDKSHQECLDELLGDIDSITMRGDYWCKDQEELYNKAHKTVINYSRARPGTQFASNRYDRDDAFILDRLSQDTVDFHMNRPGYTDENFNIILTILKFHYPNENFDWLINYRNEYAKLLTPKSIIDEHF